MLVVRRAMEAREKEADIIIHHQVSIYLEMVSVSSVALPLVLCGSAYNCEPCCGDGGGGCCFCCFFHPSHWWQSDKSRQLTKSPLMTVHFAVHWLANLFIGRRAANIGELPPFGRLTLPSVSVSVSVSGGSVWPLEATL